VKTPGKKPPRTGPFRRELIGPPDCPILTRWTLLNLGPRVGKLLLHRFLPNADDRDVHDHPRPFVTVVLLGGYDDLAPCEVCPGSGWVTPRTSCSACEGRGVVLREIMRAGMVRRRPAEHRHRTRVHETGCTTLVWMGPLRRPWGFWRRGRWWPWREYEERFGFGMRCDD
jgi:hypothetical protein